MTMSDSNKKEIVPKKNFAFSIGEVFNARELLFFIVWRDIKIRYKQTVIGAAWVLLQPTLHIMIFSFFLSTFAKRSAGACPLPVFVCSGFLPWMLFSESINRASQSVLANSDLIKRASFPRIIIPLASILGVVVDFMVAFVILVVLMAWYGILNWNVFLLFPFLLIATLLCSAGLAFGLSAFNVIYRDVRNIIPFFLQIGMFLSPIFYSMDMVSENIRRVLYSNPLTGIIEMYRWGIGLQTSVSFIGFGVSSVVSLILFVAGVYIFVYFEPDFTDIM